MPAEAQIRELSALNEQLQKQVGCSWLVGHVLPAMCAAAAAVAAAAAAVLVGLPTPWHACSALLCSALLCAAAVALPERIVHSSERRLRRRRRRGSRWSRSVPSWSGGQFGMAA